MMIVTITNLIPFPNTEAGTMAHTIIHVASLVAEW
jgi:hypothetical protein